MPEFPILTSYLTVNRSVHAKAAGAWGEFEVTHDNSDLTDAKFLTGIGTKTKVLQRISTVAGEKGSSDTVRDVRGWAMRFFTEDGNQDFVFNDLPVFFIRDPIKFPSMNRSHKRHPQTNVPDPSMFWDFHVNNPEGIHALMHLFGQRGIPASLRHINAFSVHTYTLSKEVCLLSNGLIWADMVHQDGSYRYVKWHWKPDAGIETLDSATALRLAGEEPDYHVKDLFNAIQKGDYPTWTLYVQVIEPKDVKDWHLRQHVHLAAWEVPASTTGTTDSEQERKSAYANYINTANNSSQPSNYFQDIEQAAFSPSAMVPGVGPSADMGESNRSHIPFTY
jgi:catalase